MGSPDKAGQQKQHARGHEAAKEAERVMGQAVAMAPPSGNADLYWSGAPAAGCCLHPQGERPNSARQDLAMPDGRCRVQLIRIKAAGALRCLLV